MVKAFGDEGLLFPSRVRTGPRKGELAWMPLRHWRVLRTLHNPRYAGAFVYGSQRARKGPGGKTTVKAVPRDQWTALIPDAHPGYITWERFEQNQRLLAQNAQAHGTERAAGATSPLTPKTGSWPTRSRPTGTTPSVKLEAARDDYERASAAGSTNENPSNRAKEVQCETNVLSYGVPTAAIEISIPESLHLVLNIRAVYWPDFVETVQSILRALA